MNAWKAAHDHGDEVTRVFSVWPTPTFRSPLSAGPRGERRRRGFDDARVVGAHRLDGSHRRPEDLASARRAPQAPLTQSGKIAAAVISVP